MQLDRARRIAQMIAAELAPFCEQIEIAGSIRRQRSKVNDIDIVLLPKPGQLAALRDRVKRSTVPILDGEENLIVRLTGGFQLDIFIAQPETRDMFTTTPSNFGALLLTRTGSKEHNIFLGQTATRLGRKYQPYRGVLENDVLLASATEVEIFTALGLPFIAPERRER